MYVCNPVENEPVVNESKELIREEKELTKAQSIGRGRKKWSNVRGSIYQITIK